MEQIVCVSSRCLGAIKDARANRCFHFEIFRISSFSAVETKAGDRRSGSPEGSTSNSGRLLELFTPYKLVEEFDLKHVILRSVVFFIRALKDL